MIANLGMYDRPELRDAHNRFWALLRVHLVRKGLEAPETLAWDIDPHSVWQRDDFTFAQTCGMPYRLFLHGEVTLIGTPDYGVEGCPPGYYRSALVVRVDDPRDAAETFRDARFAYNDLHSQSGFAAAQAYFDPKGFWFSETLETGGHVRSAHAVVEGRADIAAIDAVTWRLIERYDDLAPSLRVLDVTEPTPGLPYIAAKTADRSILFDAVKAAIGDLTDADRRDLGILNLVDIPAETYLAVGTSPA